ncbi:hypothetical protein BVC80_8353g4 [Macleaya cordata]|uniref:Uncharacterized protein n=1 Tax=Macleaya cordata TaxID=56857 RepID=A0A200QFP3_MACCD|nr:hypothetical protein BVC80_8353g4 [Macleaya cordata]
MMTAEEGGAMGFVVCVGYVCSFLFSSLISLLFPISKVAFKRVLSHHLWGKENRQFWLRSRCINVMFVKVGEGAVLHDVLGVVKDYFLYLTHPGSRYEHLEEE